VDVEKEMIACPLLGVADTFVGAPGTVAGVELTAFDAVEVPMPFWAKTSKS